MPIDVDRILSVPLSMNVTADKRVWVGNHDCIFKVKEAYKVAMSVNQYASSSSGADPMWKRLWRLNIPPKAKIFLWRAVWDIIPHNGNLFKKGITESSRCPRCGSHESTMHVFRDCSWVRKFWSMAPPMLCKQKAPDIRHWVSEVMSEANPLNIDLLAMLLWQIWFARNELWFEKVYTSREVCYKRAKDGIIDYQKWNNIVRTKSHRVQSKWSKPDPGKVKINFDASINEQRECYGLGVIARDDKGCVLLAASKTLLPRISAEMAELKAADWVVQIARQQLWRNIVLEGDAYLVIEALK